MLSDDLRDCAVGAVGIDDAEVAVLADPEAAGVPPEEYAVRRAADQHAVEFTIGIRLDLEPVR